VSSKLAEWVQGQESSVDQGGLSVMDRVSLTLGQYDHFLIVFLAERYAMSQAALAREVLGLALREAVDLLAPVGPEYTDEDRRDWEDMLSARYRAWLETGKAVPSSAEDQADGSPSFPGPRRSVAGRRAGA
jgi:hypothetical protein